MRRPLIVLAVVTALLGGLAPGASAAQRVRFEHRGDYVELGQTTMNFLPRRVEVRTMDLEGAQTISCVNRPCRQAGLDGTDFRVARNLRIFLEIPSDEFKGSDEELQAVVWGQSRATAIFTDGFESGDLSRWSGGHAGSVVVTAAAARLGTRGARVQAGTSCAAGDTVEILPPPATITGLREACRHLSAAGVEVVDPGATLRAGEQLSLGEGFTASADLTLEIAPTLAPFAWLRDASAANETRYTAEFHLRLDALALGPGDRLEHLVAHGGGGGPTFRLVLQSDGAGGIEALLEARRDDGSYAATPAGQEVAIPAGWHRLRLAWEAGAGTGSLVLTLDGALATQLTGLANAARRVDHVDWGSPAGSLAGAGGFLDLDAFASWN